jgi:hypothetical protein
LLDVRAVALHRIRAVSRLGLIDVADIVAARRVRWRPEQAAS